MNIAELLAGPFGTRPADALDYGPAAPVPIFQHRWEFERLIAIFGGLRPTRVLEIGTYHGGTLYHFLRHSPPGAIVVSVDSHAVPGADNRLLYPSWCLENVEVFAIDGDSRNQDVVEQVRCWGPFQFLFIDAGHLYPDVLSDWRNYGPMIAPGGIIAFHDILESKAHPEIEVRRLWREIQAAGYHTVEIVADPSSAWGGIGVVFMP